MARYEDEFATKFTETGGDAVERRMRSIGDAGGRMGDFRAKVGEAFAFLGPRIEALGERLNELSAEWVRSYKNAEQVENRLRSLGKQRGWSEEQVASVEKMSQAMMMKGGIKQTEIEQAAVAMANFGMSADEINRVMPLLIRQSRTLGVPIENLGMAMGKAYGTGNLGALKRMGVTIDDASFALWKAQAATTNWADAQQVAALRALVLNGAIKGIDQTAMPLDAIMQSAAARTDLYAAKQEKVSELLGEGAYSVLRYRNQIKGLAADWALAHHELTKTVGAVGAVTGQVVKGVGAVGTFARDWIGFAAQLKLAKNTKDALRVATASESLAEKAKTGVAGQEAKALAGVGDQATKNIGLLSRLGAATSGGLGWGMNGIMGGFTSVGGAGSGMSAMGVLTGQAGLGAALASGVVVAAAAAVAAVLIARDVKVINETQKNLRDVDQGNANLRQQWQEGQQAGLKGQVQETKRHTWWQNLWASRHADWSEEDSTSVQTTPGGNRAKSTAATTPTGDLQVTIPGDQVVTTQRATDHSRLR